MSASLPTAPERRGLADRLVVCVGSAKAGTTTLHTLMSRHPEVSATTIKETDFFLDEDRYAKGFDFYAAEYFFNPQAARILFEADPVYMYMPGCIGRIHAYAPGARIIVMLRNPVDRAFSQYVFRSSYRRYSETFEELCRIEPEKIGIDDTNRLEYGTLDRSRYSAQVREIYRYFPRDRVYFIVFERFVKDQRGQFLALQRWLGLTEVDVGEAVENVGSKARSVTLARLQFHGRYRWLRRVVGHLVPSARLKRAIMSFLRGANFRSYQADEKPQLDPVLRQNLLRDFASEIREVEALTGLDLGAWRN